MRENSMCEVLDRIENRGVNKGRKEAVDLMNFLWSNGRGEEAMKASKDDKFLNTLLADFVAGKLAAK